jgi:hypothetical protein
MLVFRPNLVKLAGLFLGLLIPINFTNFMYGESPKLGAEKTAAKSSDQADELDSLDDESDDSGGPDINSKPADQVAGAKKSETELAAEIDQALDNLAAANLDLDKYSFLQPSETEPTPAILQKTHMLDGELDFDLDLAKSLEQPKRLAHDSELDDLPDLEENY